MVVIPVPNQVEDKLPRGSRVDDLQPARIRYIHPESLLQIDCMGNKIDCDEVIEKNGG